MISSCYFFSWLEKLDAIAFRWMEMKHALRNQTILVSRSNLPSFELDNM